MTHNQIPLMTDPLSRFWDQPPIDGILTDEKNAIVSDEDWEKMAHYGCSIPSGTYSGKIWERQHTMVLATYVGIMERISKLKGERFYDPQTISVRVLQRSLWQ